MIDDIASDLASDRVCLLEVVAWDSFQVKKRRGIARDLLGSVASRYRFSVLLNTRPQMGYCTA
jgi:hypothetical protein